MGADGGTIPTRVELVKTKKKPEQKDKAAELSAKWDHCAASQEKLVPPIMACQLGRLYNKESILEHLLSKESKNGNGLQHIRSMKDVIELNLTENTSYKKSAETGDGTYVDRQASKWMCPVVNLEMNGMYRFAYLVKCGCVFSERALKEVHTDHCHKCAKPFTSADVITINPTEEPEIESMYSAMDLRKFNAKVAKRAKKREAEKEAGKFSNADFPPFKVPKIPNSFASGPNVEKKSLSKTNVTAANSQASTSGRGTQSKSEKTQAKKTSIQSDPSTSKVFKSLFTSSDKAKNQQSAHWVTCDPFYNR